MRAAFSRARITTDEQKKVAFFEVCSIELLDWLFNHFHPKNIEIDEVTFDDVLAAFDERFGVKESKRYAALMFTNRVFKQGEETVDDWLRDLERWASRSNFATYLETAFSNQLI